MRTGDFANWYITAVSVAMQGIICLSVKNLKPLPNAAQWPMQFHGLMAASLALTLLARLVRPRWLVWHTFIIRGLIYLLILQAMPEQMTTYSLLLSLLIVESYPAFPQQHALIFGTVFTGLMLWQRCDNASTWNTAHPAPSVMELLASGWIVAMPLAAGWYLSILARQYRIAAGEAEYFRQASVRGVEENVRLQEYTVRAAREGIVSERNRISREIHDSVGYALTNLLAVLDHARELSAAGRDTAPARLDNARELARAALTDVRRAVRALRPPVELNSLQALEDLAEAFTKATGIRVKLKFEDFPSVLDEAQQTTIYRLLQEAMVNAFRHGGANKILAVFRAENNWFHIRITDDGRGVQTIIPGIGLTGVGERVKALGGDLNLWSKPGHGFRIEVRLPFTVSSSH